MRMMLRQCSCWCMESMTSSSGLAGDGMRPLLVGKRDAQSLSDVMWYRSFEKGWEI